ncbi:hypothetical protein EV421DRAFT_1075796 [Armillaria borealis]|uniref:Uncharacterized protein n=1 Tax=Armillaria borealis TaxID=47425 RepID=A0AA39MK23_9AGAR|nr:hypothetical protein EV421DRAFT_1075796 [Armillaria borealis]
MHSFNEHRLSSLRYSRSTAPRSIHAVLTKVRYRQLGGVFFRSTHSSIPSPVHSRGPQSSYQPKHLVLRVSPQLHASSHASLCELHRLDTVKTNKHPATNNAYPAAKPSRLTFVRFSLFFFAILTLSRMRDRFDSSTSADENIRLCGRAAYVYRARTPLPEHYVLGKKEEGTWVGSGGKICRLSASTGTLCSTEAALRLDLIACPCRRLNAIVL